MSTSENNLNYTDWHDVDEDIATIADYGGQWMNGFYAGITRRSMDYSPASGDRVASLKNKD